MRKLVSLFIIFSLFVSNAIAQGCPMCKAAVESNLEAGGANTVGNGLNTGILYLMAIPYILVASIALFWYLSKKKQEKNAPRFT